MSTEDNDSAKIKELAESSPHSAMEPDAKPVGSVMIELPYNQPFDTEVVGLVSSLESRGWTVLHRWKSLLSTEDSSDGMLTGKPVIDNSQAVNNVINGVSLPLIDETSTYKVVRIIRPEDRLEGGDSGIFYLMNGNGDVKEYLENEGFLIMDDEQKLHHALVQGT
jgi:hypothetical protein